MKQGMFKFQNRESIRAILPRVNDDLDLSGFYKAVAAKWHKQTLSSEEVLQQWVDVAQDTLSEEWFDYVYKNFNLYIRILVSQKNWQFERKTVSLWENTDAPTYYANKITGVQAAHAQEVEPNTALVTESVQTTPTNENSVDELDNNSFYIEGGNTSDSGDKSLVQEFDEVTLENQSDTKYSEITQQEYIAIVERLDNMTVAELEGFAEEYNIDISSAHYKREKHNAIVDALESRVV